MLRVSNTALRYRPEKKENADKSGKPASTGGTAGTPPGGGRSGERKPKLYVQQPDGSLAAIRVTTGITDGTFTEVSVAEGSADDLREGLDVVTGVQESGAKAAVVNPFMPTPATPQTRPPRM